MNACSVVQLTAFSLFSNVSSVCVCAFMSQSVLNSLSHCTILPDVVIQPHTGAAKQISPHWNILSSTPTSLCNKTYSKQVRNCSSGCCCTLHSKMENIDYWWKIRITKTALQNWSFRPPFFYVLNKSAVLQSDERYTSKKNMWLLDGCLNSKVLTGSCYSKDKPCPPRWVIASTLSQQ